MQTFPRIDQSRRPVAPWDPAKHKIRIIVVKTYVVKYNACKCISILQEIIYPQCSYNPLWC